jgi:hypothetical protein
MNRHFLGPEHGLSLDILAGHVSRTTKSGLTKDQTWHSRVIEDELFLSATHVYSHTGDFVQMRRGLNDTHDGGNGICSHLGTSYWFEPTRIPELNCCNWPRMSPGSVDETVSLCQHRFIACNSALGSCAYCLTDYKITIRNEGPKTTIRIVTYHQLGSCRTPEDWKWRTFVSDSSAPKYGFDITTRTTSEGYRDGDIRRTWHTAVFCPPDPIIPTLPSPLVQTKDRVLLALGPPGKKRGLSFHTSYNLHGSLMQC